MSQLAAPSSGQPAVPHGGQLAVAPSSGQLVPDTPIMKKQTYSAVISYSGSSRRLWAWTRGWGSKSLAVAPVAWTVFVVGTLVMWAIVTLWYAIVVNPLFVWVFLPFRLMRRSQRKQEALQRQQLATMQAMMINQQRALQQTPPDDAGPKS